MFRPSRLWPAVGALIVLTATMAFVIVTGQTRASAATGILAPGRVLWGAVGHLDQGNVYANISVHQQAQDLKNVFGSSPNTILYRAFTDYAPYQSSRLNSDVTAFQSEGIVPDVNVLAYPPFSSFANEAAAYNWAYNSVAATVAAAPSVQVYEIGNEWVLQQPIRSQFTGDGSQPSDWSSAPSFPVYRGVAAGAVAAIRDHSSAQILGGALGGWTFLGLAPAIENGLVNYTTPAGVTRDLTWDFTVNHWYNDAPPNMNNMGLPDNFNNGMNAYQLLNSAQKPVIFTEFGSSDGNNPSYDTQAASNLTGLMSNLVAHMNATSTERGVVGATVYQLYQMPGVQTDYFLYNYSGGPTATLAPQGSAVKNWLVAPTGPITGYGRRRSWSGSSPGCGLLAVRSNNAQREPTRPRPAANQLITDRYHLRPVHAGEEPMVAVSTEPLAH
jgi:hypothetical protein